jgi:hypothetical protein
MLYLAVAFGAANHRFVGRFGVDRFDHDIRRLFSTYYVAITLSTNEQPMLRYESNRLLSAVCIIYQGQKIHTLPVVKHERQ